MIWSLLGAFTVFTVCVLVPSLQHHRSSPSFIFTSFTNTTGYPNAISWLTGLIQAQYCLVGADGASHVIDEIEEPHINAPKAMVLACLIGGFSAFLVLIAVLCGISDIDAVISAGPAGAVQAFLQATRSRGGALGLNLVLFGTILFAGPALMVTSSRMVAAYARDGCLPLGRKLSKVSQRYEVPIGSVLFCCGCYAVFGIILFGSVIAVQAIVSASVVLLQLSYLPPICEMLLGGRKRIFSSTTDDIPNPKETKYSLGPLLGPIINAIALAYIALTTVLFLLPSAVPVTSGAMMNWSVVVAGVTVVLAGINW